MVCRWPRCPSASPQTWVLAMKNPRILRGLRRFYRNDQSHNSEKAGYGIGLSMAKEIIELLKGKLQVSWKEGRIIFTVDIESL